MWKARTKDELMIEVWEKLDCENVGRSEIEAIETAIAGHFGQMAVDSPMHVARLLADRHALSFTAGKEYLWKKNRVFGLNLRTIYTGGFWSTPIDFDKSQETGETRYVESLAFTQQLPDYFRVDFRVSLKRNRPNSTTTLSLDLQNATNNKNRVANIMSPSVARLKNGT